MLIINPTLYERLGELLVEQIGSRTFYSGEIAIYEEQVDYIFNATLMIYYRCEHLPEGSQTAISDIVDVWWELTTTTDDGVQHNDFDFNILKRLICN